MTDKENRLDTLLARLLDQSLSEAEQEELSEILLADPVARQAYLDLMLTHAALSSALSHQAPPKLRALLPKAAESEQPLKTGSPLLGFLNNFPQAFQPAQHPVRFFSLALTLTGIFWGLVLMVFLWQRGGSDPTQGDGSFPFTAKIIQLEKVTWSKGSKSFRTGSVLVEEEALQWEEGMAQVLFGDGTRIVVEGPASLTIDNRDGLTLSSGRLLARVPTSGRGFLTRTPHMDVVDLGTEFGVDIQETETELQVFEGSVRASRAGDEENSGQVLSANQAVAYGVSPQGVFYAKEKMMNRSLYVTMIAALAIPVAGQNVASSQAALINVISTTASATLDPSFPATKTTDGSGLSGGMHSISNNDMWIGNFTSVGHTISFEFAAPNTIDSIHIWNGNYAPNLTRSLQNVQILVSPDNNPANLVALVNPGGPGGNFQFPNGTGSADYTGFELDLSGVTNAELLEQVSLVQFVVQSTYGNANFPTLAEVQFTAQRYVELLPPEFDAIKKHDVLIALHGHGSDRWQFINQTRGECQGVRDVAAKHDLILISPDYRAKTSWMGPKSEADLLQIIEEVSKRHKIDRVFLAGGSMGGTSALIFTALHPELIAGVCSLNGTANMLEYQNFQEAIIASYGGTKDEIPEQYKRRSPELFPERFTMPVSTTTGGKDTSVPPESVLRLMEKLKQTKTPVLNIHRPEGGHATNYDDTREALEFILLEAEKTMKN